MDRREKSRRLSKLFYLREEPFKICANRLRRFGYQNIEIDIPIMEHSGETEEYCAEIRKMTIDFRHLAYRYHMEVLCYDGYAAPDNIYRIFSNVVNYIMDPKSMCTADIGKDYLTYLEEYGFTDISQEGEASYDAVNHTAFRDNIKYCLVFHRIYEEEKQARPCDNNQFPKIDAETYTLYLDRFQKYMLGYKNLYDVQYEHHVELAKDLSQLDIILLRGWSKSSLSIRSGPLSVQIAADLFWHIVHCWIREKCKNDKFPDNMIGFGHIPQNFTDDNNSFEVLYHGMKYSISTKTDELVDIDSMDGYAFEQFCAEILAHNGFTKVQVTQGSRDQGVDIIAYKDDIRFGFQCKCYSADIGNKAVQEVYAGREYYNCDVAVVLTNRSFTKSAVDLAQRNRVHLWDRRKLLELIKNCKEKLLGNGEMYK